MTAKQIESQMSEAHTPSTIHLSSSLSQPAVLESSVFAGKLRVEREVAWNQIHQIDAEITALQFRREDLQKNVSAVESALVHLELVGEGSEDRP